ncbi:unnamed protein product [Orchesella dallaii]|uniref:HRDC domain-containing protein n=1 Tax=Orchesella dallaii TaxID=48710 RepID=A0ABP1R8T2_9HEXA
MNSAKRKAKNWHLDAKKWPKAKTRPQDQFPEYMAQRQGLNRLDDFLFSRNPLIDDIMKWKPPHWLFERVEWNARSSALIVDSSEKFTKMMEILEEEKTWMVDLEGNNTHSYLGMTMLIQIAVPIKSFIIHVPSCIKNIMNNLTALFECDSVVKIMHGAANDVRFLQRDFHCFPKSVVDTQFIYNYAFGITEKNYKIGFKEMARELLGSAYPADFETSCTAADWRVYPLPVILQKYAQYDTALLGECWEKLKPYFTDGMWKNSTLNPFRLSNQQTASIFKKNNDELKKTLKKYPEAYENFPLFKTIFDWRDKRARLVDEPPSEVMNTTEIITLMRAKPGNDKELRTVFNPNSIPRWVREVKDELLALFVQQPTHVVTSNDEDWEQEDILVLNAPEEPMDLDPPDLTVVPEIDIHEKNPPITITRTVEFTVENEIQNHTKQSTATPRPTIPERSELPQKPKTDNPLYKRDVTSLARLPVHRKKWISNPPHPCPNKDTRADGRICKKKKIRPVRPEGTSRRRRTLSPDSKRYQRRRRKFNNRWNRKLRECPIVLKEVTPPPPEGDFSRWSM